ncbi:MAG TPA: hypothetical protein VLT59_03560, partial [Steroidobacteraceae bacterium]|nr:hypothetical protein [Steroidobacteraceae bacterium]
MSAALVSLAMLVATMSASIAADLPPGYWGEDRIEPILGRTVTVRLAPDLATLSDGERKAVAALLEAGAIAQRIYEESRHPEALAARAQLDALLAAAPSDSPVHGLDRLYRLFSGPIATTLDNERLAFLPVAPETPARNVYPAGITREELDASLAGYPAARDSILGERTVVRRATDANLDRDLDTFEAWPALAVLHGDVLARLREWRALNEGERPAFYAVPQPVEWPAAMHRLHELLNTAADAVQADDAEFAGYLRNRARDLLTNDYESGDASWVTGRFGNLNAQIGAYETYDDPLYGVKAFMSLSILKRNAAESEKLRQAIRGIQAVEDALPYQDHKRIREDIPVGVYEVVADFGQSRGRNTATILPNDPLYSRRYGRTILLRENIMRNPVLFANSRAAWTAIVEPDLADALTSDGAFAYTLWHEVGHYLGVDRTADGRTLDAALGERSDSFEEMKSDLVSLGSGPALLENGYYDAAGLRAHRASGILRTLQSV